MRAVRAVLCLALLTQCGYHSAATDTERSRPIRLRRCNNGGCPYAASWLARADLFLNIQWVLNSTKMEEASFRLLQSGQATTYQLSRPDLYFVNHLSEFEHRMRRKTHNVSLSIERSAVISAASFQSECYLKRYEGINSADYYVSLMPFYGGLPADTDTSLFKVRSVGEGNSVANRTVKAWQGMATLCSLLRPFGRVVVGVSSIEDERVMEQHLRKLAVLDSRYLSNVQIIRFDVPRGSNLPFYLLAWAQVEFAERICKNGCRWSEKSNVENNLFSPTPCTFCESSKDDGSMYQYLKKSSAAVSASISRQPIANFLDKARFIYYTESDQVLTIDEPETLRKITAATNLTSVILGRRRYKQGLKFPNSYDKVLARGPGCGREGFFISGLGVEEGDPEIAR